MNMHNQRCIIYNTNKQLIRRTQKGEVYYWMPKSETKEKKSGIKANQTQSQIDREVKIFKPLEDFTFNIEEITVTK